MQKHHEKGRETTKKNGLLWFTMVYWVFRRVLLRPLVPRPGPPSTAQRVVVAMLHLFTPKESLDAL